MLKVQAAVEVQLATHTHTHTLVGFLLVLAS